MKVEEIIRKAIEGGYLLTEDGRWNGEKIHSINRHGSRWMGWAKPKEVRDDDEIYFWRDDAVTVRFKEDGIIVSYNDLFMDPSFWQSLGRALGWKKMDYLDPWLYKWHRFIDHLAEGKAAESFFETLT